jgi:hypothetical protein
MRLVGPVLRIKDERSDWFRLQRHRCLTSTEKLLLSLVRVWQQSQLTPGFFVGGL